MVVSRMPEPSKVATPILEARHATVQYGSKPALRDVNLTIGEKAVTAVIGPVGSGKTTLLRTFNRLIELAPSVRVGGNVLYRGRDLYDANVDASEVRRRIGMIFRTPTPFPRSIGANVAWGAQVNGIVTDDEIGGLVERSLTRAGLWREVKDRLDASPSTLSLGEQQRLCIARAIAMQPDVLLMDEPTQALDPVSSARIEDLIVELKDTCTIVMVAHTMQQAARVSDATVLFLDGELVEVGETKTFFTRPRDKRTEEYVTGRFG